jgi:hypothetical protein
MTRIIGPPRSRRRHWTFLSCLVAALTVGVFFISGAQAVHDLGVFQLDGNASSTAQSTPTASDDWDKVCHQVVGSDCSTSSNTTNATAVAWSNDCNNGSTTCAAADPTATSDPAASIFQGGGSKDPLNIDGWAWKDGVGGLPDKDNLVHAYAARYKVAGAGGTTDCATGTTCDVIYFGLDRFDNSGDAQTGFWFLQNQCSEGSNKVGGALGFACTDPTPTSDPSDDFHRNGDLLVLSDFSNGGTTATINVYRWNTDCTKAGQVLSNTNTCGDANLEFLKGSTQADCGTSGLTGDDFCGIVNPNTTTMPWSFTDKSGTASSGALNGEFYEAGVNLTPLGLGGECFASLVSETRSSTSTSATLKDFIIAPFAPCKATIATTPNQTSVSPTTHVHDTATVTGNQAGVFPSGNVTFFLCQYAVGATNTTCPTGSGDQIGTPVALASVSGSDPPRSTAQSLDVNCAASNTTGCATGGTFTKNPLAPGHYCFRATWPGDANYVGALSEDGTISQECFDVTVIATNIATTQFYYPNDTATVSTGTGNLPAGSVQFKLFSGADATTALSNCNANGSTVGSGGLLYETSATINGTTSSQTVSTSNTSVKMPSDTAHLYWRVTYSFTGSVPGYAPSSSQCVENTQYSAGTGDDDTVAVHNDKTAHA